MYSSNMFYRAICAAQILLCVIVCVTCQGWVIDDDGCRTPDRGVGSCVPIRKCAVIVNILDKAPKPLPKGIATELRKYICGYKRNNVKVCCPNRPIPLLFADMKTQEEKVDLTKHRNFNLLPQDCGYIGIPNKISNGRNAGLGEYPWMALLRYQTQKGSRFQCGGTVINDRYILTAAHCITQLKNKLIGVRVGEYDLSTEMDCEAQDDGSMKCARDPVQDLQIEKIIPHPNFTTDYNSPDGFNDIGLLRVQKMKMATNVESVCLPFGEAGNSPLSRVIITGWGYKTRDATSAHKILQRVTLPVIPKDECQKAYVSIRISDKQICANGKMQDTCDGDSGGPLQTAKFHNDDNRMVQYGIISFGGAVCGSGTYPGLYTKVDAYLDWILDNIEP